jgi:endonuclease/exonuclease/phosphatase family metal-dependent hydrolase
MYALAEIMRRFHVVAIQEISTADNLHMSKFMTLVNSTGRKYHFEIGERVGNSKNTEQFAFVYDTQAIEIDPQSVYTIGDNDNLLSREPLVASFRTRAPPDEAFTFVLVNVHSDPENVPAEMEALAEVYRVVRQASRGEDDVIMLGDFNADDAHLGRLGLIPGVEPLIRKAFSNTRQNRLLDNIVVHLPSTTEYRGASGVFDIAKELKLNIQLADLELISDHLPVWAEFSAYERPVLGGCGTDSSGPGDLDRTLPDPFGRVPGHLAFHGDDRVRPDRGALPGDGPGVLVPAFDAHHGRRRRLRCLQIHPQSGCRRGRGPESPWHRRSRRRLRGFIRRGVGSGGVVHGVGPTPQPCGVRGLPHPCRGGRASLGFALGDGRGSQSMRAGWPKEPRGRTIRLSPPLRWTSRRMPLFAAPFFGEITTVSFSAAFKVQSFQPIFMVCSYSASLLPDTVPAE